MNVSILKSEPRPRTQAERRARTRAALLEAGARGVSRYGYGNVILEKVAAEAGYTRGALYHQFSGKDELAVAVVDWVAETWSTKYGKPARRAGHTGRHCGGHSRAVTSCSAGAISRG